MRGLEILLIPIFETVSVGVAFKANAGLKKLRKWLRNSTQNIVWTQHLNLNLFSFSRDVFWISSDKDDRMGKKIKPERNPYGLTSKKSRAKSPSLYNFQKASHGSQNYPTGIRGN